MWSDFVILSLHRFLAQRLHVNIMQFNNGTNFIGTVKEINVAIKNLKHNKITIYLKKHQIKWQFHASLSSWMGGCLESLIKTVKICLYAILKNRIQTIET